MQKLLDTFQARIAPAEDIFFTWLPRVMISAALVGTAWIDDAPPLEIVAMLVAIYVAVRVACQFPALMLAAPFENRTLSVIFALVIFALLGGAFLIVVTFTYHIAFSVAV